MTTHSTDTEGRTTDLELEISGMTCSSCANRIEKKLNKLEGVTATVNYATEKAKVSYTGSVTPEDLVAVVEKTGYGATVPAPPAAPAMDTATDTARPQRRPRRRAQGRPSPVTTRPPAGGSDSSSRPCSPSRSSRWR